MSKQEETNTVKKKAKSTSYAIKALGGHAKTLVDAGLIDNTKYQTLLTIQKDAALAYYTKFD